MKNFTLLSVLFVTLILSSTTTHAMTVTPKSSTKVALVCKSCSTQSCLPKVSYRVSQLPTYYQDYKCSLCSRLFDHEDLESLTVCDDDGHVLSARAVSHAKVPERTREEVLTELLAAEKKIKCQECHREFDTKRQIHEHMCRKSHWVKCPTCFKQLIGVRSWMRHIRKMHTGKSGVVVISNSELTDHKLL